jgi:uncharacterized membrane protein
MAAATPRLSPDRAASRWRGAATRVRAELRWNRVYRTLSYARSALWIVPLAAVVLVLAIAPLLRALDAWLQWPLSGLDVEGAQALFLTTITLTLSFLVFTFSSLLVAIQVAGGQLTPRIIATTLLRDNFVRYSVGLFVFTLVLAVTALNRQQGHVNDIGVVVIAMLACACMTAFLFLIDYAARLLRPVTILTRVGGMGLEVIDAVYPHTLLADQVDVIDPPALGKPSRVVAHEGASEVVLAVDLEELSAQAMRHGGVIELVPQVGEFVAYGQTVFMLHGAASSIPDDSLSAAVAFGPERTLEQDPLFAFRIVADIALKALSPAINDPTTAVLAIDQIHRLLRIVGLRRLHAGMICGHDGFERVVVRTPDWEDFVNISCKEIRACGVSSMQVTRRLYAMFEDLLALLPAQRRAALEEERSLLDRAVRDAFPFAEDRALARAPDVQGFGSAARTRAPRPRNP